MAITKEELLMGRDEKYHDEYTQEISDNLDKLLITLNKFRAAYGKAMHCSSGWRPSGVNDKTQNAGKKSAHLEGRAADFKDAKGELREWVLNNLDKMKDWGLYCEDFRWTPTWVHLTNRPPASKKRIFIPSMNPAIAPKIWDGKYDSKYDG